MTVLGNFDNQTVKFHNIETRFWHDKDAFFVTTTSREGPVDLKVKFTFGHYPLQQYLLETDKGRLQAFNIAWDTRPKSEGGQRWFHLQPDEPITPQHPFFWQNHFQNWNSRCADCHSTNVEKAYDVATRTYSTRFSEVNVACEACHGPGGDHVALARGGKLKDGISGFSTKAGQRLDWQFLDKSPIAVPVGEKSTAFIETCASCHSLRAVVATENLSFNEQYSLNLLDASHYFPDGQIKEEDFVLGSFLQSKMYSAGVTCHDCHDPHSGQVKVAGNGLCAQCHKPSVFDQTSHHLHQPDSSGAQCVNCHMPTRTYMGVDDRRDHRFHVPDPVLAKMIDVPLSCKNCHEQRSSDWFIEQLPATRTSRGMARVGLVKFKAEQGDVTVVDDLIDILSTSAIPPIVRASLWQAAASVMTPSLVPPLEMDLKHPDSLVRRGAVAAIAGLSPEARIAILKSMLHENNMAVRYQIAVVLLDVYFQIPSKEQLLFAPLLADYEQMLMINADMPSAQMGLANLAIARRQFDQGEQAYLEALTIAPGYLPAQLNLADLYRGLGRVKASGSLLKQAVADFPDSGLANHSFGLHLIRQKQYQKALGFLGRAIESEDTNLRFFYVYAVALHAAGEIPSAIEILKQADQRWPNQQIIANLLEKYRAASVERQR